MELNFNELQKESEEYPLEHERVIYKHLVLHLLRDYFHTEMLKEIVEDAQDFLNER